MGEGFNFCFNHITLCSHPPRQTKDTFLDDRTGKTGQATPRILKVLANLSSSEADAEATAPSSTNPWDGGTWSMGLWGHGGPQRFEVMMVMHGGVQSHGGTPFFFVG